MANASHDSSRTRRRSTPTAGHYPGRPSSLGPPFVAKRGLSCAASSASSRSPPSSWPRCSPDDVVAKQSQPEKEPAKNQLLSAPRCRKLSSSIRRRYRSLIQASGWPRFAASRPAGRFRSSARRHPALIAEPRPPPGPCRNGESVRPRSTGRRGRITVSSGTPHPSP